MDYRFREIRKGECAEMLAFAKTNGCSAEPTQLHPHLSLVAKKDGEVAAAALCLEQQPHQFVIEIVHREGVERELVTELANRCFRKVQSEGISSARINSPAEDATQTIWQSTNWLDRIQETAPPETEEESEAAAPAGDAGAPPQAA